MVHFINEYNECKKEKEFINLFSMVCKEIEQNHIMILFGVSYQSYGFILIGLDNLRCHNIYSDYNYNYNEITRHFIQLLEHQFNNLNTEFSFGLCVLLKKYITDDCTNLTTHINDVINLNDSM